MNGGFEILMVGVRFVLGCVCQIGSCPKISSVIFKTIWAASEIHSGKSILEENTEIQYFQESFVQDSIYLKTNFNSIKIQT